MGRKGKVGTVALNGNSTIQARFQVGQLKGRAYFMHKHTPPVALPTNTFWSSGVSMKSFT